MRLRKPRPASPEKIRITREGKTAVIAYADPSIRGVHFRIGATLSEMTDAEILERFNAMLEVQAEFAAGVDRTLTEIPPGQAQIAYHERGGQWVLRGQVLRCHVEDDAGRGTLVYIDDVEFDMHEFGRMLGVYAGFGMRITFVDEDDVAKAPVIVVKEPDDEAPDTP